MSLLTSDVKDVVEQYKQKYGKKPTINEVTDALRGRFREDIDPAWVRDQLERISEYDSMKG